MEAVRPLRHPVAGNFPVTEQPSVIIHVDGPPLTERQVADLKERFAAVLADPSAARAFRRQTLRLLPRRTRLRLWCTRQVDTVAIWLCDRGRYGTAQAPWRLTTRRRAE